MALLDDDGACLEDVGLVDDHSILVEVRSRDGTWPEEITSLATTTNHGKIMSATFSASVAFG